MMKTNIKTVLTTVLILMTLSCVGQQLDIEINTLNQAGFKLKNLSTNSASSTYFDLFNDNNSLFQMGITGQNNNFFNSTQTAYLYTAFGQNVPLAFATNGQERMRIDSDGRVGVGINNSLDALMTLNNPSSSSHTNSLSVVHDRQSAAVSIISSGNNYPGLLISVSDEAYGASILTDSTSALRLTQANGSEATLEMVQRGTGFGASFEIDNTTSTNSALAAYHNGIGSTMHIVNSGNGQAASFTNNSTNSTISAVNYGNGHALFVQGTAMRLDASPNWNTTSDRRLKKEIKKFDDGLDVITAIEPVSFRYNGLCGISPEKQNVGVIAQDIEKIAPYMVEKKDMPKYPNKKESTEIMEDVLTYNPTALPYILVNAVKTLNAKIESQEEIINRQSESIKLLLKKIEGIESQLVSDNLQ